MEIKGFFQFEIISDVLVIFPLHLNTYMLFVHGYYKYFNSSSEGTVFKRQNLTYVDVRFWVFRNQDLEMFGPKLNKYE